ncbi:MAG: hypothetical protein ABIJ21_03485 [Nanoarchaeota archaeon]
MNDNTYWTSDNKRGLRYAGFTETEMEYIRQLFPMFHPFGFKDFLHLPEPTPVLAYERELTTAGVRFDNDDLREDYGRAYWPLERILTEFTSITANHSTAAHIWKQLGKQPGFIIEYPPGNQTYALDEIRIAENQMNWETRDIRI